MYPRFCMPPRRRSAFLALALASVMALSSTLMSLAATLVQISSDPFTNTTSEHKTQVEPDTYSFGNTVVAAFQSGRFYDGGASDIGWATSTDGGVTWTHGFLPGITTITGDGPFDRVSDPAVAYDAKHNVWIISSLALLNGSARRAAHGTHAGPGSSGVISLEGDEEAGPNGVAVLASRSTDGGLTWGNPVTIFNAGPTGFIYKNWTVCDDTPTSPFYGNCYTEFDDFNDGDRVKMTTSTDGGLTWSPPQNTANNATGLGGQPVVQPNGTVIVPLSDAFEFQILAFKSTNGGASWSATTRVSLISHHSVAGPMRSGPLPSAEIDGAGKVYVVWSDCRFRPGCTANDIVMSTSTNGTTWSSPARIPIAPTSSNADFFIPGLGVDKATSGSSAHLGLTFYGYPNANCTASTCQLEVGFIASTNGGSTWGKATKLAGPMNVNWIANTSQGRMVGDYISTSFTASGKAVPAFAVATAPTGGGTCDVGSLNCNEATFSVVGGLPLQ